MSYPKTLTDWAQKVIDIITPLAKESNKTFYPLQFPVKMNPEILIIGLNPGGDYPYQGDGKDNKGQVNDAKWGFVKNRMTISTLLKGNPHNKTFKTWKIYKGLAQLPIIKEVLEKGDFCFMNYFYLNTHNFKDTETDLMDKTKTLCKQLTYEFIQLVQPKRILILGTANGFDQIQGIEEATTILNGRHKRLLMNGKYAMTDGNYIPICGIAHPSYPFGQLDEVEALKNNIQEVWQGKKEFTTYKFGRISYQFDINQLNNLLPNNLQFTTNEDCYDLTLKGDIDHLLIRIVEQKSDKYIAYGTTIVKDRSYKTLRGAERYLQLIKNPRETKTKRWLATQNFRYGCHDKNDYQTLADTVQALYREVMHIT